MFLDVPRADLYGRAEARFDKMVAAGALDEVAALEGYDLRLPVMKAIGVPELTAHVRGELTREEAVARAKIATRNYIKRQLTWWRAQMGHWRMTKP